MEQKAISNQSPVEVAPPTPPQFLVPPSLLGLNFPPLMPRTATGSLSFSWVCFLLVWEPGLLVRCPPWVQREEINAFEINLLFVLWMNHHFKWQLCVFDVTVVLSLIQSKETFEMAHDVEQTQQKIMVKTRLKISPNMENLGCSWTWECACKI